MISAFLAGEALAEIRTLVRRRPDHRRPLAVLRERAAGPLELILLYAALPVGLGARTRVVRRDAAMAGRLLAGAGAGPGTLVVAGNAHTPVRPRRSASRWVPSWPRAGPRPRDPDRLPWRALLQPRAAPVPAAPGSGRPGPRLLLRIENLTLVLPSAREAVVPQRPWEVSP